MATSLASLTEKFRPQTIDQFIGLDRPRKAMARFVAAPREMAWLFVGASGTGKTTMALAVAKAISAELHHVPSQQCDLRTIERLHDICQYMPAPGCRFHLILVDEADKMSHAAQIALLSQLDSTDFPANTIFIFTANETGSLEPRFLSRLHELEFSSYGIAKDAAALLERIWLTEVGTSENAPNFARIVKERNNNVRAALMSLETEMMCA